MLLEMVRRCRAASDERAHIAKCCEVAGVIGRFSATATDPPLAPADVDALAEAIAARELEHRSGRLHRVKSTQCYATGACVRELCAEQSAVVLLWVQTEARAVRAHAGRGALRLLNGRE